MGVGKGRQGGHAPPGFSRSLSKTYQISKYLPFLDVNTGFILIDPPLKNFLQTPLKLQVCKLCIIPKKKYCLAICLKKFQY